MPSLYFLRVVLLMLGLFFSFMLGRVGTRLHLEGQPYRKATRWILRVVLVEVAMVWRRPLDLISILGVSLSVACFLVGVRMELHPRKEEEIHLFDKDRDGET